MKLTLTDHEGEVLNTWEVVESYPEGFDFEDLDNDWADDKIIINEIKETKEVPAWIHYGEKIITEILRMWKVGRR